MTNFCATSKRSSSSHQIVILVCKICCSLCSLWDQKAFQSCFFFIRIVLGSLDMEKWSRHFFDEIGKKNPIILFPIAVDVERIFLMKFHLWETWAKYINERVPRSNCAEISSLKPRKYLMLMIHTLIFKEIFTKLLNVLLLKKVWLWWLITIIKYVCNSSLFVKEP